MTDFMTAHPVILIQPTCPGDQRAKFVQFQSTCNLCRESHKTQVWLCFLILSFSSIYTCAASLSGRDTEAVQTCVKKLKGDIEKSDAMLYAPSSDDVNARCKIMSLTCYMKELKMVIGENNINNEFSSCIWDFTETLPEDDIPVGCPPCEAYSLKNITIFLDRLNNLLEEMTAGSNT